MASPRDRLYHFAVRSVASRRRNPLVGGLARACRAYLSCYENVSYDARSNGELRVLDVLARTAEPILVFDVGANVGDWTLAVAERAPHATIHSFEIVPQTAAALASRLAGLPQVVVNPIGLSDEAGTVEVKYYPSFTAASGTGQSGGEFDHIPHELIQCEVRRGDGYCAERGIAAIDLLKIDTEGLDLRVLRGFDAMLATGAIKVIQFEYGRANIALHDLLFDFYRLLDETHGYVVGKIFPRSVEFAPYTLGREDFLGSNFLAVHRTETAHIERLAGARP